MPGPDRRARRVMIPEGGLRGPLSSMGMQIRFLDSPHATTLTPEGDIRQALIGIFKAIAVEVGGPLREGRELDPGLEVHAHALLRLMERYKIGWGDWAEQLARVYSCLQEAGREGGLGNEEAINRLIRHAGWDGAEGPPPAAMAFFALMGAMTLSYTFGLEAKLVGLRVLTPGQSLVKELCEYIRPLIFALRDRAAPLAAAPDLPAPPGGWGREARGG